jgi:hypothetical protein
VRCGAEKPLAETSMVDYIGCGSGVRLPYAPPYTRNPNLKPVGKGFGFLLFDLQEYIGDILM